MLSHVHFSSRLTAFKGGGFGPNFLLSKNSFSLGHSQVYPEALNKNQVFFLHMELWRTEFT